MASDVKRIMDIIAEQTAGFLKEEVDVEVSNTQFHLEDVNRLQLKYLTSLLSVGGNINMYLVFSFDEKLMNRIFEVYTEDIDIEEDEREEYVEETAGDVINIIVGNATAALQSDGVVIQLSPPVILTEAKKIGRQKDAAFYMADMQTPYGDLSVFCAGPKKLLDDQLNYVETGE